MPRTWKLKSIENSFIFTNFQFLNTLEFHFKTEKYTAFYIKTRYIKYVYKYDARLEAVSNALLIHCLVDPFTYCSSNSISNVHTIN